MESQFVDKKINISRGKDADDLLKEKNDKQFLKDGVIKKVSQERWEEAQEYEKHTWCFSEARGMTTDRNEDHMKRFGGYSMLNINLGDNLRMIELGCGPFTNLRLIIPQLYKKIVKVDLLDPLLNDYVQHTRNCTYRSGVLSGHKANLINSSIEDFEVTDKYDLIVMMNVLEHCRDIDLIFEKIKSMMHENSIFLFHDVAVEDDQVDEIVEKKWDAGHPILLTDSYLKKLVSGFRILYKNATVGSKGFDNEYYYILKK